MLLSTAVPQGLSKSFNARTFLQCLGLLHFTESLWSPCSKSPPCPLQFHPFKTGFGHQMTSNTHQAVLAQLLSHAFPEQLVQGWACPGNGRSSQKKPTRQHTLLVIFRFSPQTTPQLFQRRLHQAELHPYELQFWLKADSPAQPPPELRGHFSCPVVQFLPVEADCWIPAHLTSAQTSSPEDRATPTTSFFGSPSQKGALATAARRVLTRWVYVQYSGGQGSYRSDKTQSITLKFENFSPGPPRTLATGL